MFLRSRTRLGHVAAAMCALALMTACSDGDSDDDSTSDSAESGSESTGSDDAAVTSAAGELPQAPDLEDAVGARREARFEDCSTTAGAVTVPGQVTNTQKKDQDYVVTVSWIVEGSEVIARGIAEVNGVPADETVEFEVSAEVPSDAEECTFNVRRAPSA